MADNRAEDYQSDNKHWQEIPIQDFPVGTDVDIQNKDMRNSCKIFFGPEKPTDRDAGIILPPSNWPLFEGKIETKLFFFGNRILVTEPA